MCKYPPRKLGGTLEDIILPTLQTLHVHRASEKTKRCNQVLVRYSYNPPPPTHPLTQTDLHHQGDVPAAVIGPLPCQPTVRRDLNQTVVCAYLYRSSALKGHN